MNDEKYELDRENATDALRSNEPEREYRDQREDFCFAIRDTGFNVDLIAQSLFTVLTSDQCSQVINRLNKKLNL